MNRSSAEELLAQLSSFLHLQDRCIREIFSFFVVELYNADLDSRRPFENFDVFERRRRCGSRLRRFLFPLRDEKPGVEFEPG